MTKRTTIKCVHGWRFRDYKRESPATRKLKSEAAKRRQARDRIVRAALLAATLALGGCATMGDTPDTLAATPGQRVAQLQAEIIASGGHADAGTMTRYGRALLAVNDFANADDVLTQAIDPAAPDPIALNWRGAARAELGRVIEARADFEQSAAMGNDPARQNLAKLEPPKVAATSTPKRAAKRTGGHPRGTKSAPLALYAPDANGSPAKIRWLEKPL